MKIVLINQINQVRTLLKKEIFHRGEDEILSIRDHTYNN